MRKRRGEEELAYKPLRTYSRIMLDNMFTFTQGRLNPLTIVLKSSNSRNALNQKFNEI